MELEKQIFADCYNFLKKNIEVSPSQEYWANIVTQAAEIEKKYNNKLAVDMLYACTKRLCELHDKEMEKQ